ncbi:hypothetical protein VNO80_06714 [Phaseolus coccineus]|uniref:Uncharacterized protein n=1 Tax=Phaseolus coccineus TaxID=3886 RepID=A0AAN9NM55_PHACN
MENLNYRKADLAEGQTKEELREADFHINMDGNQKVKQFHLIKQLEREQPTNEKKSPSPATATKSAFNEIKDFQSHVQDGRGGGNPQAIGSWEISSSQRRQRGPSQKWGGEGEVGMWVSFT